MSLIVSYNTYNLLLFAVFATFKVNCTFFWDTYHKVEFLEFLQGLGLQNDLNFDQTTQPQSAGVGFYRFNASGDEKRAMRC